MLSLGIVPFNKSPTLQPDGFILKCGSGIFGHEILNLKNPLIASIAFFMPFFAVSIGFIIAFLIPFQVFVAAAFISFQMFDAVDLILL